MPYPLLLSNFDISRTARVRLVGKGKTLKWILREAVADLLPKDLRRRSKHGFNVPIDYWLKGEWYDLLETAFSSESELVTKEF